MCFQVYLGASQDCPEIPYPEEEGDVPRHISVRKLAEQGWFPGAGFGLTTAYQYHVRVMSCGCGFSYDIPANNWDDHGWTLNNHRQLGEYVAARLERSEPIELLSCWSGDEFLPVEKYRDITVAELLDPQFYFEERQLTVVYKNRKSLKAAKRLTDKNR
jgi:hypothetical protein